MKLEEEYFKFADAAPAQLNGWTITVGAHVLQVRSFPGGFFEVLMDGSGFASRLERSEAIAVTFYLHQAAEVGW